MKRGITKKIASFFSDRRVILTLIFITMSVILLVRLFHLQIVQGKQYADHFTVMTTRKRVLQSTRGNIYDTKGKLLAYNKLSNSVTIEDNGTYSSSREKNLSLNGEIYQLTQLIQKQGDALSQNFHIHLDEDGKFAFDVDEGTVRNRFRADIYGYQKIEKMNDQEANASASEIMEYLTGENRFGLVNREKPYTKSELSRHGLPEKLSEQEQLDIVIVRYNLSLISYQRYVPVTVAEDVSDQTVAAVEENKYKLQGVNIAENSKRVYNNAESMAPIIGYTGKPSAEELQELNAENDDKHYTSNTIVGKAGIEQVMETDLQGTNGSEKITVDNLGKIRSVDEDSLVEPTQGNDVYLTIDSELQEACYKILEQRIAGILLKKIRNTKYGPKSMQDADNDLYIPIYDVYYALIDNNIIDITRFSEKDASTTEKKVYDIFRKKQTDVLNWLEKDLSDEKGTSYKDLNDEQKSYVDYIYKTYLIEDSGILNAKKLNRQDKTWLAFTESQTISLGTFLRYATKQNWIDTDKLIKGKNSYLDSSEIYQNLISSLKKNLAEKTAFSRLIYKYVLLDGDLDPKDLCQILYDQGILDAKKDSMYQSFRNGGISAYSLIISKIRNLEITPAQLALDPCSGSAVITDPDTGQVKALVTYPGYDNNWLANDMDTEYYNKLYRDKSTPFYNKATQQLTAPGSTFKLVMAAAGLNEGVVNANTYINCTGLFGQGFLDKGDQLHCWLHSGHGPLNLVGGLENSCNVYFCTVGYKLGVNEQGKYSQAEELKKIQEYSSMFTLDKKSGIQITESEPHVTDDLAIPSAIGQGTHQYTTTQIARYAAILASNGTSHELNLLSKVTDSAGKTIRQYQSKVVKQINLSDAIWSQIHQGMRGAMANNTAVNNLPIELYGKTGTAQEASNRPSHSLVIGHSHYKTADDIAFTIRIAFGYGSRNACLVANDMLSYYYNLKDEAEILTGKAAEADITDAAVTD